MKRIFDRLFATKTAPVREFAVSLAQQIMKRYPPHLDQQPGKRPSVNRLTRIIEDACNQALEFNQQANLGWMAKARLGNEFRWSLTEAGYTKEFTSLATEAIVVYLSRRRPTPGVTAPGSKAPLK